MNELLEALANHAAPTCSMCHGSGTAQSTWYQVGDPNTGRHDCPARKPIRDILAAVEATRTVTLTPVESNG